MKVYGMMNKGNSCPLFACALPPYKASAQTQLILVTEMLLSFSRVPEHLKSSGYSHHDVNIRHRPTMIVWRATTDVTLEPLIDVTLEPLIGCGQFLKGLG